MADVYCFFFTDVKSRDKTLFKKKVVCCIYPVTVGDTADMQLRRLTQGLVMYSVKHQMMKSLGFIVNPG